MDAKTGGLFHYRPLSDKERKNLAILELIRKKGHISRTEISKITDINVVSVSSYIKDYIDVANIYLKSFKEEFYNKYCGGRLKPVLESIKRFYDAGIHIEITTLIIPGLNDNEKELEKIAKFIASVDKKIPWHISRFFPMYKMLDKLVTPIDILEKAYKIGKKHLKNVYIGNV